MAISSYKTFLMHGTAGSGSTVTWSKLIDIQDYPDLGGSPEALETTTLSDKTQTYIPGIQSLDTFEFTTNYTKAAYTTLNELAQEEADQDFAIWFGGTGEGSTLTPTGSDGKFQFKGKLSVWVTGGGVNEVVKLKMAIAASTSPELVSGT